MWRDDSDCRPEPNSSRDERLTGSRFLRHDLAVPPHVDRCPLHLHPGGLASDLGGSAECAADGLGKGTGGLILSAGHGACIFCQLATGRFEAAQKGRCSHPPNPRRAKTRLFPSKAAGSEDCEEVHT